MTHPESTSPAIELHPRPSLQLAPSPVPTPSASWSTEHAAQLWAAAEAWGRRDPGADPATELYRWWYAADASDPSWHPWWPPVPRVLRAAHAGTRCWTEPTPVVAVGLAGTIVTRDAAGVARAHSRGDYATVTVSHERGDEPGHEPTVGTTVRTIARGGAHVADGWWRTWGGGWRPSSTTTPTGISRIYLAPRTDRLTTLVRRLTAALVDQPAPWQVKAGADPMTLSRADGVVVYLPDAARATTGDVLISLAGGLVADRHPPLTCALAPGISWAHDPGNGDSFGQTRCTVVAEALLTCGPGDDPVASVDAAFRRHGLDPAAPHRRGAA